MFWKLGRSEVCSLPTIFVGLLDNGQFGMWIGSGKVFVWSTFGTVKEEVPLLDETRVLTGRIELDFQLPTTSWVLAPSVRGHEGPFREAIGVIVIVGPLTENHRPISSTEFYKLDH